MNILWFLVQVWKMRRHQSAYFKERKQSDLFEAKRFEKIVDAELVKRLIIVNGEPTGLDADEEVRPTDEQKQETLFE